MPVLHSALPGRAQRHVPGDAERPAAGAAGREGTGKWKAAADVLWLFRFGVQCRCQLVLRFLGMEASNQHTMLGLCSQKQSPTWLVSFSLEEPSIWFRVRGNRSQEPASFYHSLQSIWGGQGSETLSFREQGGASHHLPTHGRSPFKVLMCRTCLAV